MKCICCDSNIKPILDEDKGEEWSVFTTEVNQYKDEEKTFIRAENRMWGGGIVGNISAGYGSNLDGECYVIAICDKCTNIKKLDGTIAHVGNYMEPEWYRKNDEESARQIWRRYNQLDNLLG